MDNVTRDIFSTFLKEEARLDSFIDLQKQQDFDIFEPQDTILKQENADVLSEQLQSNGSPECDCPLSFNSIGQIHESAPVDFLYQAQITNSPDQKNVYQMPVSYPPPGMQYLSLIHI
eukprot:TRINITY_DN16576_c0_g1_i1.p1 TRINITY_DN16576_c0_g1~~TRINITY_DN16576_c0_g1_i1.p1  ORF type:complete len:117 (+),score=24.16 TRINITY_DN16576_c0_g1_i1:50-400(+)